MHDHTEAAQPFAVVKQVTMGCFQWFLKRGDPRTKPAKTAKPGARLSAGYQPLTLADKNYE